MTSTLIDSHVEPTSVTGDPAATGAPPAVRLRGLSKRYGDVLALDDVSLEIGEGEFVSILGPSGSGKTTTMRMIGGFEQPDAGTVEIAGREVNELPPYRRDVNTVFQSYALFPHMSVVDNVAYGLRMKGAGRKERRRRAQEMLDLVQLRGASGRYPAQLSGGMKQRVALARGLVNDPSVLLLDEPLGALDRKLREDMQVELKRIQMNVGITFVYVTHDQEEALSMSDRIVVMRDGRIEQIGSPADMYDAPASLWVADFVGTSSRLPGTLAREGAGWRLRTDVAVIVAAYVAPGLTEGDRAVAVVRPESIRVSVPGDVDDGAGALAEGSSPNEVQTTVEEILNMGAQVKIVARTAGGIEVVARVARTELAAGVGPGTSVTMSFGADAVRIYAPDAATDGQPA